jgi:hypothetical protein
MIIVIADKAGEKIQGSIELLSRIKTELKRSPIAKEICKEHGFSIDIIDGIPMDFSEEIDTSARTVNSAISLSSELMNEDFQIMMRYAIHELVHALQHMKMEGMEAFESDEYLDRPDELEAFQYQIEYESETMGQDKAEEYVDNLIEYHEIPPEVQEGKKQELLDKTD